MAAWAVTVMQQKQPGATSCVRQARLAGPSLPLSARSSPWAPSAAYSDLPATAASLSHRRSRNGAPDQDPGDSDRPEQLLAGFRVSRAKYVHEEMCPEASEFLDVPFGDVARAFGAHGERVTSPEQFIPALRRAEESANRRSWTLS